MCTRISEGSRISSDDHGDVLSTVTEYQVIRLPDTYRPTILDLS